MPKRIASLFSGCGGLDLGFTGGFNFGSHSYPRLDTQIVFANDFDRDAFTCYNANPTLTTNGTQCLLADIRDVKDQIQMYVWCIHDRKSVKEMLRNMKIIRCFRLRENCRG